jgi:hypothetical protein
LENGFYKRVSKLFLHITYLERFNIGRKKGRAAGDCSIVCRAQLNAAGAGSGLHTVLQLVEQRCDRAIGWRKIARRPIVRGVSKNCQGGLESRGCFGCLGLRQGEEALETFVLVEIGTVQSKLSGCVNHIFEITSWYGAFSNIFFLAFPDFLLEFFVFFCSLPCLDPLLFTFLNLFLLPTADFCLASVDFFSTFLPSDLFFLFFSCPCLLPLVFVNLFGFVFSDFLMFTFLDFFLLPIDNLLSACGNFSSTFLLLFLMVALWTSGIS